MRQLEASIHYVFPLFQGFDMKLNLDNFLTLNSEYSRLSFTYLNNFYYSADSLIGATVTHLINLIIDPL